MEVVDMYSYIDVYNYILDRCNRENPEKDYDDKDHYIGRRLRSVIDKIEKISVSTIFNDVVDFTFDEIFENNPDIQFLKLNKIDDYNTITFYSGYDNVKAKKFIFYNNQNNETITGRWEDISNHILYCYNRKCNYDDVYNMIYRDMIRENPEEDYDYDMGYDIGIRLKLMLDRLEEIKTSSIFKNLDDIVFAEILEEDEDYQHLELVKKYLNAHNGISIFLCFYSGENNETLPNFVFSNRQLNDRIKGTWKNVKKHILEFYNQ
jgi:hypothetical protein